MARLTQEQKQERVQFVRDLLARYATKGEIKRAFRAKFGDFNASIIEDTIKLARESALQDIAIGRQILKGRQADYYGSLIRDRNAGYDIKLRAATRIDKLLGLEEAAPTMTVEELLGRLPPEIADAARRVLASGVPGGTTEGSGTQADDPNDTIPSVDSEVPE